MTQPTEPVEPIGSKTPAGTPEAAGVPAPDPAPTQPLPPAQASPPAQGGPAGPQPAGPPAGPPPPGAPGGTPPAGPPPRQPGLWKQATSTTGGLIAVIVAACLAGLMVLGLLGAGVAVAAHVVSSHHDGGSMVKAKRDVIVPPGQRKRLEQGPGSGGQRGPGGMRGPAGGMGSLLQGAAGLGAVQHGEFTVTGSDGKATAMTLQRGTVTAASSTSVTVKSTDGFTATYTIDGNTLGARSGSLATGDAVTVIAQKSGNKAVLIRANRTQ